MRHISLSPIPVSCLHQNPTATLKNSLYDTYRMAIRVSGRLVRFCTLRPCFGFATGDWEGSRCGIRTRIALQNPVAQVVVAILWGHGPFATPGQGGCSLGMHGSPPKRREKKARRSAAGRPSRRFGPPRRSWGLTHCVRSRLRRELYHPQRSSETLRLACKIAPICLIPSEVEIETQGAPLESREGVHVNRHRMVDDLVEELFAEFDFTVP